MSEFRRILENYLFIREQTRTPSFQQWICKFFDLMKSEYIRLQTFENIWIQDTISKEELAKAGFFYLYEDKVQCAFCRGILHNWCKGYCALTEHCHHFYLCPFIMGEQVGNIPIGDDPILSQNCIHC